MITFDIANLNLQPLTLFCVMVQKLNDKRPKTAQWHDSLTIDGGIKFIFSVPPTNWKPGFFQQMVSVCVEVNADGDILDEVHANVMRIQIPTYGIDGQNSFYDIIGSVINEIIEDHELAKQLFGEIK